MRDGTEFPGELVSTALHNQVAYFFPEFHFFLFCLRSEGVAANCYIVFYESPMFDQHRKVARKLGNCVNWQAFIFTNRAVAPGEELRWKYNISQAYRNLPGPPTPTSSKHAREHEADGLDPDCVCGGDSKCKLGSCWYYNGRVSASRRRPN
jgi:hypothetical protein